MIATAIAIVNFVALLAFVALSGATVFAMLRRLVLFRRAGQPLPVLLKRGVVLMGALLMLTTSLLCARAWRLRPAGGSGV